MPSMPGPHLIGILRLDFILETITGLLIRMPVQVQAARIGGADAYPMITKKVYKLSNVGTKELDVPYIPGSSLKGKMRSLLEQSLGKKLYTTDYKIWLHVRNLHEKAMSIDEFEEDVKRGCEIDDLFGYMSIQYKAIYDAYRNKGLENEEAHAKTTELFMKLAPTRLLVSDLYPSATYVEKLFREKGFVSIADFLEEKSENRIDRVTSAADPRDIVRVKPHVEFEGRITLLVFNRDLEQEALLKRYLETLFRGLKLVEETYLGSSGSRGYGRFRFKNLNLKLLRTDKEMQNLKYEKVIEAKDLNELINKVKEISEIILKKLKH